MSLAGSILLAQLLVAPSLAATPAATRAPSPPAPAPPPAPPSNSAGSANATLELVPLDRFGFAREFLAEIGAELQAILHDIGADVRWRMATPEEPAPRQLIQTRVAQPPAFVEIVISGSPPAAWDAKDDAMGRVIPVPGERRHVIMFPIGVLRVLRLEPANGLAPPDRYERRVATAMARVIAHELVHVVAPDHPHTDTGLMRGNLSRRSLLGADMTLDPRCRSAFLAGLDHFLSRVRAAS